MNRLTGLLSALALGFALAAASGTAAEDLTDVAEIVKRTNHTAYYQGGDGRARVKMTITDQQGRTREREFTILRKNADDRDEDQYFYVYFHAPADVREMVFMVHKNAGRDDDRWLYLPALDVIRRIAASDVRTSFVGSHFFYEDVSGRGLEEDHHELIETTDVYYVLRNTPKNPAQVEFDAYTMYIHKGTFIPVKVEYEQGGQVYRTVEALEVQEIDGYMTVTKSQLTDTNIGGHTEMAYQSVEYGVGLPDDIFTERYLRMAPRQHLR